jgi:PAS domain S-box-containing protein
VTTSLQGRIFRALLGVAVVTLLVGVIAAISLHFISRDIEHITTTTWPTTDATLELNLALHKGNLGLEQFLDGDLDNARAVIGNARQRIEHELGRLADSDIVGVGPLGELSDMIKQMFAEQDRLIGLREIDDISARQLIRSWDRIGELMSPLVLQLADDRGVSADLFDALMELHHLLSLANADHVDPPNARIAEMIDWTESLPAYRYYVDLVDPYLIEAGRHTSLSREHTENYRSMQALRLSVERRATQIDRRLARLEAQMRKEMLDTSQGALELTAQTQTLLLLAILLATALAIALSRHLARAIGQPLHRLGEAVSNFGRDRSLRVDIRTGDELQTLAETFNTMAASLDSTTVTRDYFDDIITSMLDGLFVIDTDDRIRLANLAGQQLAGLEIDELDGRTFSDLLTPGSRPRWTDSGHTRLAAGELEISRPDGTTVPVLFSRARMGAAHGDHGDSVVVLRDIRLRKQQEADLLRAKEEAELGERTKSEFLANISHEIRTPLNGVIGMLQLLLESRQEAEQREYTQVAHHSAEVLLRMLDEILELTRLNSGRLELEASTFGITDLVDEIIELYTPEAVGKGLELACLVAADVPTLSVGDPARVRQILVNLVGNAIKFTEQGRVGVEVAMRDDDMLEFTVSDTGIGIEPGEGERLFDSFSQVDGTVTRRFGGTGLGLAIVHQLTTLMDGSVDYTSERGVGSTFRVHLPLPGMPGSRPPPVAADLHGRQLLIADANPLVQLQLDALLDGSGALTTSVNTLDKALLEVVTHDEPPDLCLFDGRLLAEADPATRHRLTTLWQEANLNIALLVMQGQAPDPSLGPLAEAPRIDKPLTRSTLVNGLARTLRESPGQSSRSA